MAVLDWPATTFHTQLEETVVEEPESYQPVSPLMVGAVPYVIPFPPVTVKKYWVTVVVVIAWAPLIGMALRTVTVETVETGLLEPPLILYADILVPVPADLPFMPLRINVTLVPLSYQ